MAVRRWSRRLLRDSTTVIIVSSLLSCAGVPEPILRSNAKVQLQGREASKLDVAVCQQKAEAAGLKPGVGSRSGNMAAGAGLGVVAGAAVGASTVLRRLVDGGLIEETRVPNPDDERRIYYRITGSGRERLRSEAVRVRELADLAERVVG